MMSRSWGAVVSIGLISPLLASGCGIPLRPLAPQLAEQARRNKQAIVLLRLAVDARGQHPL